MSGIWRNSGGILSQNSIMSIPVLDQSSRTHHSSCSDLCNLTALEPLTRVHVDLDVNILGVWYLNLTSSDPQSSTSL
ncbi:hypothetical protein VNO77_19943 [Canavalia gladiata]|uniref:Uncharacterized protein n=1 Tax=Canavalia gladiata TaxID=3824 RepID=A0AAN9LNR1_CANGL